MNQTTVILVEALTRTVLSEFVSWQQQRARDAAWKPSAEDIEVFLSQIRSDTPSRIEAEAKVELGT